MSGGSEVPTSNVAIGSLVLTSSVNSGVTISRPVAIVTSGMVPACIQSGNMARGGPGTLAQPGAQNVAVALLTGQLL